MSRPPQLIVETVENFSRFKKAKATLGMDTGGCRYQLVVGQLV